MYKYKKVLLPVLACLCVIILVFSLVVTYGQDKYIPTWDEIFITMGLKAPPIKEDCEDYISFIDVGQGDCVLIHSNGQTALIDCGEDDSAPDLYKKLRGYGINKLDFVLLSHLHSDHIGGLPLLMREMPVSNIMFYESNDTDDIDEDTLALILKGIYSYNIKYYEPVTAARIIVGDIELTVLGCNTEASDENNRSVAVMAKVGENKFLFLGDSERKTEKYFLNQKINIDCDVLKVSHHGSGTSSTLEFLEKATPEFAVISCGEGNSYGHPNGEVIDRIEKIGAEILRTDKLGDIVFDVTDFKKAELINQ